LTRQNVPILDRSHVTEASQLAKGAYVLADFGKSKPDLILMASGSEVHLVYQAAVSLAAEGVNVRAVSFPSWELFEQQETDYRDSVLPPSVTSRLAVEAGSSLGWERYTGTQGKVLSMTGYGASAPFETLFEQFGFTVENVMALAKELQ